MSPVIEHNRTARRPGLRHGWLAVGRFGLASCAGLSANRVWARGTAMRFYGEMRVQGSGPLDGARFDALAYALAEIEETDPAVDRGRPDRLAGPGLDHRVDGHRPGDAGTRGGQAHGDGAHRHLPERGHAGRLEVPHRDGRADRAARQCPGRRHEGRGHPCRGGPGRARSGRGRPGRGRPCGRCPCGGCQGGGCQGGGCQGGGRGRGGRPRAGGRAQVPQPSRVPAEALVTRPLAAARPARRRPCATRPVRCRCPPG